MNPEQIQELENFATSTQATLGAQNSEIKTLQDMVAKLQVELTAAKNSNASHATTSASAIKEPKVAQPEYFTGDRKKSRSFMLQLKNNFHAMPKRYATDEAKVSFAISFLRGPAFEWIAPYLERQDANLSSFAGFETIFKTPFHDISAEKRAEDSRSLNTTTEWSRL